MERDYSKCDVCGQDLGPDRMHVLIDNGHVTRHTYACRRHRYVQVKVMERQYRSLGTADRPDWHNVQVFHTQERTDLEVESLAHAFRFGELAAGWE